MRISTSLLGAAALFMAVSSSVQAITLVTWNYTGLTNYGPATLNPSQSVGEITATLSRGPGMTTDGTALAASWGGAGISTSATSATPAAYSAAMAAGDYFSFRLDAAEGATFSLDSINAWSIIRNPTTGVQVNLFWMYSADGGAFTHISNPTPLTTGSSGGGKAAVTLSGISALQDASSVEFRLGFYGLNAVPASTLGVMLRNTPFSISGSVVPEPSTYALIALGGVALAVGYLRRRKGAQEAA